MRGPGETQIETDRRIIKDKISLLKKRLVKIDKQSSTRRKGREHLIRVALVGYTNAGKSTLLNALLQEDRAIVSDIPGTTRDTIEEVLHLEGLSFRFIDTAGIRESEDVIESAGIERTREKIDQAHVVIYLFDASTLSKEDFEADLAKLKSYDKPYLVLANKTDISSPEWLSDQALLAISAKAAEGIDEIKSNLLQLMELNNIDNNAIIISNNRHFQSLSNSAQALQDVVNAIELSISGDLLALDIRRALHSLGEITGEITPDDLLGEIFSNFCIGK